MCSTEKVLPHTQFDREFLIGKLYLSAMASLNAANNDNNDNDRLIVPAY